ncbi:MAG: DNA gyrase subunit A, partial [SAR324 cluster bacterium]|nr:DNA gyrase subunit A [SAR324 cluster bacterium]
TRLAHELLSDIDKDTVDFQPNYDDTLVEPRVMPTRLPNLLLNGSTGIAVGMACNIPPHNLTETLEAFLYYIDHRDSVSLAELMKLMPGPDFPTGGFILGRQGILDAYTTGRGVLTLRAKCEVELGRDDRERIIVHELPYVVNKARLIEKIADLVRDKHIEGISDLRDESDRKGMRIMIEVKRGANAEVVLNNLYKHTQLQTSFGVIMLALVDNQPRVLRLPQVFQYFLDHRIEVVERRTRFELGKAETRQHLLEGLRIALEHLDDVIEKIKAASSPADARSMLIGDYQLSPVQAKEILEMRLQRLTALEQKKIQNEFQEVTKQIAGFQAILADQELVLNIIREETQELKERYGDERRTQIVGSAQDFNVEDLIEQEDMVVTISRAGYVKRSPLTLYRTQRRGGRGKVGMTTREEDFVDKLFIASTHDYLLIFTSIGKIYWKKVYEIPEVGRTGRGKPVVNLVPLQEGEQVRAYLPVSEFSADRYVLMATAKGVVKKTELLAYSNPRAKGVRAINIDEGDQLAHVVLVEPERQIFFATRKGLSLRMNESDIRPIGRVGRGVIGIRLNAGDSLVGLEVLTGKGSILTITENGFGKKTEIADYRTGSRGNKGIFTIKTSERNGNVVGILQLSGDEEVMLLTLKGKLIRLNLDKLRTLRRVTQGVKLVQVEPSEHVVAIAKIDADVVNGTNGNGNGGGGKPKAQQHDDGKGPGPQGPTLN